MSTELEKVNNESVFSLANFDHTQRVAKMLCTSDLVPKRYQGNIQNTMIALEMAGRIGAVPLMVMQHLYVVNGTPGWSSTFMIASINSCGRFNSLRYEMSGAQGSMDRQCIAWTVEKYIKIPENIRTLADAYAANLPVLEGPPITMSMAKAEGWLDKAGSKWKTMPELMIRYRSAAFWTRLYAPEITMGLQTQEEVIDVVGTVVDDKPEVKTDAKEQERMTLMIGDAKTFNDLKNLHQHIKDDWYDVQKEFVVKMKTFTEALLPNLKTIEELNTVLPFIADDQRQAFEEKGDEIVISALNSAKSMEDIAKIEPYVKSGLLDLLTSRKDALSKKK